MMNYGYSNFYNPYNPTLNPLQRIQQYEQANSQMFQQPVQQQTQTAQQVAPQTLIAIPVSTIEEAKAYIVDSFGVPTLFYNASKNEIYLKKTNRETAAAEFFVFAKVDEPLSDVKEEKSINTYEKDFKALNDKIDGLYSLLEPKTKKAVKSDE